jgi:hypothetical protein
MAKFQSKDEELFLKIASNVITFPEKYLEAGKWLDQYYDDNKLCAEKQKEIKKYRGQLSGEIVPLEARVTNPRFNDEESHLEGKLFTKVQRLAFLNQFETEKRPSIKERLAYAMEDLYKDYQCAGVLSEQDARDVLLIVWVATDAKTNEMKPSITKFANVPWKTKAEASSESRFGLASFLFLDLDLALHYEYLFKPKDGLSDQSPIYELDTNYLRMIHRSWAKIKAEKEITQKPKETGGITQKPIKTGQKIMPKEYVELAEQIADNLEDWANPIGETGIRNEYTGCLKPIDDALKGIDELLSWLHLNSKELGEFLQINYDSFISKVEIDNHLMEHLYEGNVVFSEEDALDFADTLRSIAKTDVSGFIEKPKEIPLEIRVAKVLREHPNMKSSNVAKLAEVKGRNAAGIVRGTKAWQNRKQLRGTGKIHRGKRVLEDVSGGFSDSGKRSDVVPVFDEPQAEHKDINEMITEFQLRKRKTYPTPEEIAQRLSTPDEVISIKRAKELLKETKSIFGYDD